MPRIAAGVSFGSRGNIADMMKQQKATAVRGGNPNQKMIAVIALAIAILLTAVCGYPVKKKQPQTPVPPTPTPAQHP